MMSDESSKPDGFQRYATPVLQTLIIGLLLWFGGTFANGLQNSAKLEERITNVQTSIGKLESGMTTLTANISALSANFITRSEFERSQRSMEQRLDRIEGNRK